jgi:hypothetical protein
MKLYSQSEIGARIKFICKAGAKFDNELHTILCSILTHTAEHGDPRNFVPLADGLPDGVRKQGIVTWINHFSGGQVKLAKSTKTKTWGVKIEGIDGAKWSQDLFDLDGAYGVKFGDFSPEPVANQFGYKQMLKMLKAKATNMEVNADGTYKVSMGVRNLASTLIEFIRENGLDAAAIIAADEAKSAAAPVVPVVPHVNAFDALKAKKELIAAEEAKRDAVVADSPQDSGTVDELRELMGLGEAA